MLIMLRAAASLPNIRACFFWQQENVELFASLNTDVERKNANAWWGKGIYTVPKAPHEWKETWLHVDTP